MNLPQKGGSPANKDDKDDVDDDQDDKKKQKPEKGGKSNAKNDKNDDDDDNNGDENTETTTEAQTTTTNASTTTSAMCSMPSINDYPNDIFTQTQRRFGAVIFHFAFVAYLFVAITKICDNYFMGSLEIIGEV